MGRSGNVVGVVWGVAYPCRHPTGGERGEAVLVVDPAHANHVHHVSWIIKSTKRREGEGRRGREREGRRGREKERERINTAKGPNNES